MEIKEEIQREYNPAHPNYQRWQRARELSDERAKFVEGVLSKVSNLLGLSILDLGAGEGSTSKFLSKHNFVVSLEIKRERINKIEYSQSLQPVLADGFKLPFKNNKFDVIIMQDVIEHMQINDEYIASLYYLLKKNGLIYLSTPNRYSIFNIISDPHWGLPFLALFKREQVKKYFLKYLRKDDYQRTDTAELFSLHNIYKKFSDKFSITLYTKYSVDYLLNGGKGLVWSNFHLGIINLIKSVGLRRILLGIANDKPGVINNFFTPTFYFILKKV